MKNIILAFLTLLVGFSACTDKALDPLKFDAITSGALIALRGKAVDNLGVRAYQGSVDSFSISKPANEKFEIDVEFLSAKSDNLKSVEIYATTEKITTRKKVATIDAASFSVKTGSPNPVASIAIPLSTILTALGVKVTDFSRGDVINIECDLTLKDGGVVPAGSIVNSSLFESTIFYPAHNMRYLAGL